AGGVGSESSAVLPSMRAGTPERTAETVAQAAGAPQRATTIPELLAPYFEQLRGLAARCRVGGTTDPSFLDWHSGLRLAGALLEEVVFSPWTTGTTLPYLDRSVHVVVVPGREAVRLAEARRVASVAVFFVEDKSVEWVAGAGQWTVPSVSVIVPVCNHAEV